MLFPHDERGTQLVEMPVTSLTTTNTRTGELEQSTIPHPELLMDMVAEGQLHDVCSHKVVDSLEGMTKKFTTPYVVFYGSKSRTGEAFPINKTIRQIQGSRFQESKAWRGDVIAVKYEAHSFTRIVDCNSSDFPLLRNWFINAA
ncbi:hypothetical protein SISNIDRAFT_481620 [Sistotremastrum niveocremeum HHB9708]|uniref:Uncharacterized protein n=2 Tax=Sistotremastraceae TaxID=3402574 RepID=A0A164ZHS0_9AGAM|nr:hypothetical protein SISNIDRAFT_481620 [Sistotremastrum niveocremeum HHB9708]KZT41121.1 hypothetical protein SISSUDRAFT_982304 [Sistotremastrum suecicum HHB10207 ss-3]